MKKITFHILVPSSGENATITITGKFISINYDAIWNKLTIVRDECTSFTDYECDNHSTRDWNSSCTPMTDMFYDVVKVSIESI